MGRNVDFIGIEWRWLRDESGEWNDYTFAEVLVGEVTPLIVTTYVFITILTILQLKLSISQTFQLSNTLIIKLKIINKKKE